MARLCLGGTCLLLVLLAGACSARSLSVAPPAGANADSTVIDSPTIPSPDTALGVTVRATVGGQSTIPPPTPTATPISVTREPTATKTPLPTPTATATVEPSPTPCASPGHVEHGAVESSVAGKPMAYRVYVPPCYGVDGRSYPALYMFGGNIHDDSIWDSLGLDEAAETAVTAGDIPPLLIIMPDNGWLANTTTSGPNSYEGFVLNELISHIENRYCAWPAREGRAVGGLSRGGYWSLMMGFRRADLFRSVGAHSPALIDSHAGPAEDPTVTGTTLALGDLRIWVDIGERDPYIVKAQLLHEALAGAGVAHEWRVNPGTHEEAYWRERIGEYLAWYSDGWRVQRELLPGCVVSPAS